MREVRQELGLVAGLVLVAFIGGRLHGSAGMFFAVLGAVYLGWILLNVFWLVRWVRRPRRRTPVSYGIWERIFDDLQAIDLRSRRHKRALRDLVRRFRLVVGGMADAVVLLDDRARVRWFNPAAKRLLGFRARTVSKRPIVELVTHPLFVDQANASPEFGPLDIPSPASGAVVLRISVSALAGTGQRLLIARDITKTYHLERARKDFVANVSHELRTPLTVFHGYLETMADDIDQMPDLAEPIGQLVQQSTRMQELVEDLLDLTRLESADRVTQQAPVAVPVLIRSIIEEARLLDGAEKHEIVEQVDTELQLVGNAAILRTAFSNLVFNAVKHTGAGTRVVVEWAREDDWAIFRVRDDGAGIAAHHLPRLTERFYRVNSSRSRADGGTGLGLAIVKHALERHGADLQIDSAPGHGTVFTCHFSAAQVRGPRGREPSRPRDTQQRRPRAREGL